MYEAPEEYCNNYTGYNLIDDNKNNESSKFEDTEENIGINEKYINNLESIYKVIR